VFAQVRISALNTILTTLYLTLALPLVGVHLPLAKTMLAVTFVVGLLPVVGNLVSNTIIVILSLSVSLAVAVVSLVFLVIIHKLVVYSKRAVNAWGFVQAGLRAQHDPLSRPQMGWSSLHSTPHDGVLPPLASGG
jgi:hypothetical protein